jgi:predicted RNA-binding Zn ribbon-like protein
MTGQVSFGSDDVEGVDIAVDLVNTLAIERAFGRPLAASDAAPAVRQLLGCDRTWPPLRDGDLRGLTALAQRLREVVGCLDVGDLDGAARQLNDLLATHPAHPHLAKDEGQWRLHHHPVDADLVPMATAICAEAIARLVGAGAARRLATCGSDDCDRVFLDGSKNGSRRFCSTTCQNRVKAAAYRRRQATPA